MVHIIGVVNLQGISVFEHMVGKDNRDGGHSHTQLFHSPQLFHHSSQWTVNSSLINSAIWLWPCWGRPLLQRWGNIWYWARMLSFPSNWWHGVWRYWRHRLHCLFHQQWSHIRRWHWHGYHFNPRWRLVREMWANLLKHTWWHYIICQPSHAFVTDQVTHGI